MEEQQEASAFSFVDEVATRSTVRVAQIDERLSVIKEQVEALATERKALIGERDEVARIAAATKERKPRAPKGTTKTAKTAKAAKPQGDAPTAPAFNPPA